MKISLPPPCCERKRSVAVKHRASNLCSFVCGVAVNKITSYHLLTASKTECMLSYVSQQAYNRTMSTHSKQTMESRTTINTPNFSTCHSYLLWHLYFLLPFILFDAEQEPIVPLFEDNYPARTSLSLLFRDVTRELVQVVINSTTIRLWYWNTIIQDCSVQEV